MNILHGLLYPVSYVRRNTMLRLGQVFSELTLLSPTEEIVAPQYPSTECSLEVKTIVPAPLMEDLEYFRDLIANWKSWAKEMGLGERNPGYTFSNARVNEEESLSGILNTLRGNKMPNPLLDARIFLQLSLDLDRDNDELQTDLDAMTLHQDKLKSILNDPIEPDKSKNMLNNAPPYIIESLLMPEERLTAWTLLWQRHASKQSLWQIGESLAIKDLIDKAYEALMPGKTAVDLLTLGLPLDYTIKLSESKEINRGLTSLINIISNTSSHTTLQNLLDNGKVLRMAEELQHKWRKAVNDYALSPVKLTLTLYPEKTWEEVLSKAAGQKFDFKKSLSHNNLGWSFFLY